MTFTIDLAPETVARYPPVTFKEALRGVSLLAIDSSAFIDYAEGASGSIELRIIVPSKLTRD
jgi:hypothetical protein